MFPVHARVRRKRTAHLSHGPTRRSRPARRAVTGGGGSGETDGMTEGPAGHLILPWSAQNDIDVPLLSPWRHRCSIDVAVPGRWNGGGAATGPGPAACRGYGRGGMAGGHGQHGIARGVDKQNAPLAPRRSVRPSGPTVRPGRPRCRRKIRGRSAEPPLRRWSLARRRVNPGAR